MQVLSFSHWSIVVRGKIVNAVLVNVSMDGVNIALCRSRKVETN